MICATPFSLCCKSVVGFVSFPFRRFDAYASGFFFICTARSNIGRSRLSDGVSSASSLIRLYACIRVYIYIYYTRVCIIEPCCANVGASTCATRLLLYSLCRNKEKYDRVAYVPQHFLMHATSVVCTGVPKNCIFPILVCDASA